MKRTVGQATLCAYIGVVLLLAGFFPGLPDTLPDYRLVHALWHVMVFVGAALLVYGLETLRLLARRHRRMTS
ncbi:hypothetical protein [Alicyclobacillus macrosporangiidus]|uniref:hypothetical protein n=1 Tax=Alicyclobacillus macrosporangiidus TaxID=392015 RepID=UPI00049772DA|nr:hypothetical protein [Alicyclobacillus macrosporangiidus]